MPRRGPTAVMTTALLVVSAAAGGCAVFVPMPPRTSAIEAHDGLLYPDQAPLGPDLDIIVQQNLFSVTLSNRTANSQHDVQLWLNQQWVNVVPVIAVGPGNRYSLSGFTDQYGEAFPMGALFAPDKRMPLVSAELFNPRTGLRHRLVARSHQP